MTTPLNRIPGMGSLQLGYIASEIHVVLTALLVVVEVWLGYTRMIFTDQLTSNSATICPLYGCGGIDPSQFGSTVWGSFDFFLLTWGITTILTYTIGPILIWLRVESKVVHGVGALTMGFFGCIDLARVLYFLIVIAVGQCNLLWYCRAFGWVPLSPFFVIWFAAVLRIPLAVNQLVILYMMMQCGQVKKRTEEQVYKGVNFQ